MPDVRKPGVGQLLMVVGGAMLVTSLLGSGRSSKKKRSEQHISGCSCGAQTVKKSGLSQWIELGKFLAQQLRWPTITSSQILKDCS